MNKNDKTFSVTELNSIVRGMLETRLGLVRVRGEISNFSRPSSGHMYFTLKDDRAQIRCAFFRNRNIRLRTRPSNGQEVVVSGQVSLYEARGDYQMIVETLEDAGEGRLQLEFEQLKQKLFLEGLFDEEKKKSLPAIPKQLGIITSATGAALQDVLHVIERRFPSLLVNLYPVAVQGEESEKQIINAFKQASSDEENDVVLLTRGGGSIEDLWSFNSEPLARLIAESPRPIVTGIGHEIDFTIADFAADQRAPTPSAAAELITPEARELLGNVRSLQKSMENSLQQGLNQKAQTTDFLAKTVKHHHPGAQLQLIKERHKQLMERTEKAVQAHIGAKNGDYNSKLDLLKKLSPGPHITRLQGDFDNMKRKLELATTRRVENSSKQFASVQRTFKSLSHQNTLDRGYAIVRDERSHAVIRDPKLLSGNQSLLINVMNGEFRAKVADSPTTEDKRTS